MIINDKFINDVRNTDIFQEILRHIRTPLQKHIMMQRLEDEEWDEERKSFYRSNISLYAEIYLTNEENRQRINDEIITRKEQFSDSIIIQNS